MSPRETDDATPHSIRIQLIKKILNDFRRKWKRDYLVTLQIRKKWFSTGPDIRIGNLVLLAEYNQAPLQWKTGRVQETYPGNEFVRVVNVKIATGQLIGPIAKLRKLPLSTTSDCYGILYYKDLKHATLCRNIRQCGISRSLQHTTYHGNIVPLSESPSI